MLQFSQFVWALSYSVWDVFKNFLFTDETDRNKISDDQKRFFIALSLYPLSFFANTPFNNVLIMPFVFFFLCNLVDMDPDIMHWWILLLSYLILYFGFRSLVRLYSSIFGTQGNILKDWRRTVRFRIEELSHSADNRFIHSCIHAFILSFVHLCIHPFIHSCIHPFIHSCIHPFIHPFMHSPIPSFTYSFILPSIHPFFILSLFIYSFILSFTYSYIHWFIYSFVHLFINCTLYSVYFKHKTDDKSGKR